MKLESLDLTRVVEALEALRQEVAHLSERVTTLESQKGDAALFGKELRPLFREELSEELILVISAAVAAYLGKKAPIRQIRLLRSAGWAQQGRLTIQASHTL